MSFVSAFIGVPQSRYAGLAILLAAVIVSLLILLGKYPIPPAQRVQFIFMVFLVSLPSLALSLFQLTCIVTGSAKNWWCSAYAWIVCAMIVFYAIILVVSAIMSNGTVNGYEGFAAAAKKEKEKVEKKEEEKEKDNKAPATDNKLMQHLKGLSKP